LPVGAIGPKGSTLSSVTCPSASLCFAIGAGLWLAGPA
jgi:hypothetical protein